MGAGAGCRSAANKRRKEGKDTYTAEGTHSKIQGQRCRSQGWELPASLASSRAQTLESHTHTLDSTCLLSFLLTLFHLFLIVALGLWPTAGQQSNLWDDLGRSGVRDKGITTPWGGDPLQKHLMHSPQSATSCSHCTCSCPTYTHCLAVGRGNPFSLPLPNSQRRLALSSLLQFLCQCILIFRAAWTECRVGKLVGCRNRDLRIWPPTWSPGTSHYQGRHQVAPPARGPKGLRGHHLSPVNVTIMLLLSSTSQTV